jgi:hypothetical protein
MGKSDFIFLKKSQALYKYSTFELNAGAFNRFHGGHIKPPQKESGNILSQKVIIE